MFIVFISIVRINTIAYCLTQEQCNTNFGSELRYEFYKSLLYVSAVKFKLLQM